MALLGASTEKGFARPVPQLGGAWQYCEGKAIIAASVVLLLAVAAIIQRSRRHNGGPECVHERQHVYEQNRPLRQRIQNNSLGLTKATPAKRTRRYHSIAILTETTPLMMEQGDDFFGPPTSPRLQRPRRSRRKEQRKGKQNVDHRRRNFTAPSMARSLALATLEEVDNEADDYSMHTQQNSANVSTRGSLNSTVCSGKTRKKTVVELAHEWDQRMTNGATTL